MTQTKTRENTDKVGEKGKVSLGVAGGSSGKGNEPCHAPFDEKKKLKSSEKNGGSGAPAAARRGGHGGKALGLGGKSDQGGRDQTAMLRK